MHAHAPHPLGRKVGGEGSGGVVARFGSTSIRDISEKTLTGDANKNRLAESLDLVRGGARRMPVEHALLNGFGFGGVNASLVLGRYGA